RQDQTGTESKAHHKSGTQPGQLDITSRRWSRSRPSRSRRKVRKPDLACAFVDRHLYARQSARHVQDYPAVLTIWCSPLASRLELVSVSECNQDGFRRLRSGVKSLHERQICDRSVTSFVP